MLSEKIFSWTEGKEKKWIFSGIFILYSVMVSATVSTNVNHLFSDADLVKISQQLLLAAKTRQSTDSLVNILQNIPAAELGSLQTDDQKKAFWINIYNAYTQIILLKNPDRYQDRGSFFKGRQINIAGEVLSLDDIEHGLLRHSKIKWSLGYLNKWFPPAFEKKNRVKKLDYRIHFSLNCGAKSCPPVAFYAPEKLDKQLDLATKAYLRGESEYDSTSNRVTVPALLSWFRRDFGGKRKIRQLLVKLEIVPPGKNPIIHFKKYDWNLFLDNFKDEQ